MDTGKVRPARQAGGFYSDDPNELRSEVAGYIEAAAPEPRLAQALGGGAQFPGWVTPHAGHRFSGATAGHVYRRLRDWAPEVVVLVAPSHHAAFPVASVWNGPAYATPLGEYPIDRPLAAALAGELPGLQCQLQAEALEHSIEVQVPFLQVACPGARMLPLLVGSQDRGRMQQLAEAMGRALERAGYADGRRKVAFLASSDGFHGYVLKECLASDDRLAEAIEAMDESALYGSGGGGDSLACGRGAIAAVMAMARHFGATRGEILDRSTSADAMPHHDGQWVVGYVAAEFR
jgi:AmmeMemoRadiSam system protein B